MEHYGQTLRSPPPPSRSLRGQAIFAYKRFSEQVVIYAPPFEAVLPTIQVAHENLASNRRLS